MPSTAASQIIFFIAAMLVAMVVAGSLITTTQRFSNDLNKRGTMMGDTLLTKIKVINDPVAMPYNTTNKTLTLYILNTGSTNIPFSNATVHIQINSTYYSNLSFVMPGGVQTWGPNVMLTVYVHQANLAAADYLLWVVVQGGVSDTMTFRIS